jgi:hypothetical protein
MRFISSDDFVERVLIRVVSDLDSSLALDL